MSDNKVRYVSSSSSLPTVLTGVFVGLKLAGVIDWSWWWVLSPTWITALVLGAIFVIVALVVSITGSQRKKLEKSIKEHRNSDPIEAWKQQEDK